MPGTANGDAVPVGDGDIIRLIRGPEVAMIETRPKDYRVNRR